MATIHPEVEDSSPFDAPSPGSGCRKKILKKCAEFKRKTIFERKQYDSRITIAGAKAVS
jgi:hypothetical protein